jgi:hypothetical protein
LPVYVVCTECPFLRAYAQAADAGIPPACPHCGSEMVVRDGGERFEPAYVSRVTRSLHDEPSLPLAD